MTNAIRHARPIHTCILALAVAAVTPAFAQNYGGLLKNTPAEKFNDEDNRLFNEAAKKALDETAVGETVSWANPATQSHGDLKVLKEFTWKENPCRQIRIHNESHGRKATNSLNMCKVAAKWRMVSPTELEKR